MAGSGQPPANNFVMPGVPAYQPNGFQFDLAGSNQAVGDLLGTSQYDSGGKLLGTGLQNFNPTIEDNGFDWGTLQGWGQALGGIGDIGQAYMAYKNFGLAKDQFNFSKDFANRNLANQASVVNADLQQRAAARNTFAGGSANKAARVNGSAIG